MTDVGDTLPFASAYCPRLSRPRAASLSRMLVFGSCPRLSRACWAAVTDVGNALPLACYLHLQHGMYQYYAVVMGQLQNIGFTTMRSVYNHEGDDLFFFTAAGKGDN